MERASETSLVLMTSAETLRLFLFGFKDKTLKSFTGDHSPHPNKLHKKPTVLKTTTCDEGKWVQLKSLLTCPVSLSKVHRELFLSGNTPHLQKAGKSVWEGPSVPFILTCGQAELLVRGAGLTHRERETRVVVTAQLEEIETHHQRPQRDGHVSVSRCPCPISFLVKLTHPRAHFQDFIPVGVHAEYQRGL